MSTPQPAAATSVEGPAPSAAPPGPAPLPRHVAIIMDGNGRWAALRGKPRTYGHRMGASAVRATVEHCLRRGIPHLTLFAFSSENWSRPASEVGALMALFLKALDREVGQLSRHGVRLEFIGDSTAFSEPLRERMRHAVELTRDNRAIRVNVAVNYGGRWDIANACRRLAERVARGELEPAAIDVAAVGAGMALADQPEPDLFIRSGGDQRISNFLLWQLAYTELVFIDTLWPDFGAADLDRALAAYAGRERRFGMTGEQIRAAGGSP
jgi:undecaprenyl diphosphate synthase